MTNQSYVQSINEGKSILLPLMKNGSTFLKGIPIYGFKRKFVTSFFVHESPIHLSAQSRASSILTPWPFSFSFLMAFNKGRIFSARTAA